MIIQTTYVSDKLKDLKIDLSKLKNAAEKHLSIHRPEDSNFTKQSILEINFVEDKDIQDINKTLRNKDKATDVLSWSLYDRDIGLNSILGEIYISDEYVIRKAKQKNKPLEYEIIFLITHGILHIFGYEHQTDEQEQEMDSLTADILMDLGIDYYENIV